MDYVTLNTRRRLPSIGFGTWEITPEPTAQRAVLAALKIGYRVIDTARIYGNERGVGAALRDSGIAREDIFITTKLWNDDQGYDRTLKACDRSLKSLGLEYLDLYLIHWPATRKRQESWRALEELYRGGRIKAAGVSNFTTRHLQELLKQSDFKPAVNQVEFHPFIYEQQKDLITYCQKQNILIEAYSPLNRISHEQHEPILQLAAEYGKTTQQIVLRWCIQHKTLPLVRSVNRNHLKSNFAIFDFVLSKADMELLDSLSDGRRVTWDPCNMG